jgi:predicted 3-demethylubiquinone-9 3-methyltransferase (glyoxalase superfamily)
MRQAGTTSGDFSHRHRNVSIDERPEAIGEREPHAYTFWGLRRGWLKDRHGLYWQIAPSILGDMMKDPDRMRAKRVAEAMLNMVKLDVEGLQSAYEGRSA